MAVASALGGVVVAGGLERFRDGARDRHEARNAAAELIAQVQIEGAGRLAGDRVTYVARLRTALIRARVPIPLIDRIRPAMDGFRWSHDGRDGEDGPEWAPSPEWENYLEQLQYQVIEALSGSRRRRRRAAQAAERLTPPA